MIEDKKMGTITLRGTFYPLEQAWKLLDDIMISQHRLYSTITSSSHNSVAGSHEKSQPRTDAQHTTKASITKQCQQARLGTVLRNLALS